MADFRLRLVAVPALAAATLAALAVPASAAQRADQPAPGSDQAVAQAAQTTAQAEAGMAQQSAGQTAQQAAEQSARNAPHPDAAKLSDVHNVGLLGVASAGTRSLPEHLVRPHGLPRYALPLHARPSGESQVVGRLARGDRFTTHQTDGGWTFIRDRTTRAEGWAHFTHPHHTAPMTRLPGHD